LLLDFNVVPQLIEPDSPQLSYGQQFGLVMTPLAGLFGASVGFSLALCRVVGSIMGAASLVFSTLAVGAIVLSLWQSDVARYGRDVSQIVLYAPFLAGLALVLATALICVVWAIARRRSVESRPT
jgi:hypothetical protein